MRTYSTMLRDRPVWATNLSATLIGFGMFASFVLIPQFVEMPKSTGYGFGSSVTEAGPPEKITPFGRIAAKASAARLKGWIS